MYVTSGQKSLFDGFFCSAYREYGVPNFGRKQVDPKLFSGLHQSEVKPLEQIRSLRHENAQRWEWLEQTIDFPEARRQEFTITAAAMGLSLNQIGGLLAIVLGAAARPSRSAVHRIVEAAGRRAGRVLKLLDERCHALILVGCLDEIFFHGRPVLVGVEPASMVWFLGGRAADRSGPTWLKALRPWSALE